jgi:hypothetical protein
MVLPRLHFLYDISCCNSSNRAIRLITPHLLKSPSYVHCDFRFDIDDHFRSITALQRFTNIGTIIGDKEYSVIYYSPAETYPIYNTIYSQMIKGVQIVGSPAVFLTLFLVDLRRVDLEESCQDIVS